MNREAFYAALRQRTSTVFGTSLMFWQRLGLDVF